MVSSGTVDSIYGPTKNIWRSNIAYSVNDEEADLPIDWRIAGGSSGGSAVAVATGTCFAYGYFTLTLYLSGCT